MMAWLDSFPDLIQDVIGWAIIVLLGIIIIGFLELTEPKPDFPPGQACYRESYGYYKCIPDPGNTRGQ